MTSSSTTTGDAEIEFGIWKAIAGFSLNVPSHGSRVYYFPEGHAEHILNLNSISIPSTAILCPNTFNGHYHCRVDRVEFLVDPQSEQVFSKLLLSPVHEDLPNANFSIKKLHGECKGGELEADNSDIVSYSKTLTPSDANNGGGFSVPRSCALYVFPPLDFDAEPPAQNLFITDISGKVFPFRHIYRGTPRRHLLTTGWSKFVNYKKLVAGDSVVFMQKKSTGKLLVGVRKALKGGGARCHLAAIAAGACMPNQNSIIDGGNVQGFWGSVKAKPVLQAVEMANNGMPFEVLYYPRPEWANFVVIADMVERSVNVQWNAGMRIKMKTKDLSRMTCPESHGTVLRSQGPHNWLRHGFYWRMLQIKWDGHNIPTSVTSVNPWDVEHVTSTTTVHSAFPLRKKIKVLQDAECSSSEGEEIYHPREELSISETGCLHLSLSNYTSSASMQGARHNNFSFSNMSNFKSEIIYPKSSEVFMNYGVKRKCKYISTELNIGNFQSKNLSPDSQSSEHYSESEVAGKVGANISRKNVSAIKLFGRIIYREEPADNSFDHIACTEGESQKAFEDVEGINDSPSKSLSVKK